MALVDILEDIFNDVIMVIAALGIVLLNILVIIRRTRPTPGNNPFSLEYLRAPEALETDHSMRSKILKQRFRREKIPEYLDAIVIGSGIGGLSVAVLLSRAGKKVLVLEQHDQAGGCCHTFMDKGFEFDTGIHYVGKMKEGTETRILMDFLTDGQLDWAPIDDHYDIVAIGPADRCKKYPMMAGRKHYFENLKNLFPDDHEAIDKFMNVLDGPGLCPTPSQVDILVSDDSLAFCPTMYNRVKSEENRGSMYGLILPKIFPRWIVYILLKTGLIYKMFPIFNKYAKMTLGETLDNITDNAELKAVLSYAYGDLGPIPSQFSLPIYCSLVNHYIPGAFYPLGGPSEIPLHMIPIIERHGGRVLVDACVTEILMTKHERVSGVRVTKNGRVFTDINAKMVISDAGVSNTFKQLLPIDLANKTALYKIVDDIGPSSACISVFAGLEGTKDNLQLPAANIWAFTSSDLDRDMQLYWDLEESEAVDIASPLLFIGFPSAKDPTWESRYPGKSTCSVFALCPHHWFSSWSDKTVKRRGYGYESLKKAFGQTIWRQVEMLFPQLEGKLEYFDVGTPLSNKYYLGCPSGEMYGLNHVQERVKPEVIMQIRPETEVPGLYLTGQDIFTGGFAGALYGGVLCASSILHRNLLTDLKHYSKDVRKRKMKQ